MRYDTCFDDRAVKRDKAMELFRTEIPILKLC